MRVKHKANVVISDDTTGKDKLFGPDDVNAEVTLDGYQESVASIVQLEAAEEFTVPLDVLNDVQGFFLRATKDFTVAINGSAALPVKRGITGSSNAKAATCRILFEGTVTSIVVTAEEELKLWYAAWGDPVA